MWHWNGAVPGSSDDRPQLTLRENQDPPTSQYSNISWSPQMNSQGQAFILHSTVRTKSRMEWENFYALAPSCESSKGVAEPSSTTEDNTMVWTQEKLSFRLPRLCSVSSELLSGSPDLEFVWMDDNNIGDFIISTVLSWAWVSWLTTSTKLSSYASWASPPIHVAGHHLIETWLQHTASSLTHCLNLACLFFMLMKLYLCVFLA